MKELNVCWNVYRESINNNRIGVYNVFEHGSFLVECAKYLKKYKDDRKQAEKEIHSSLKYYFWSKCEFEILLYPFIDPKESAEPIKIDVYEQVNNNWDIFFDYVWEHRKEICSFCSKSKLRY